jgi:hypothetical protein
MDVSEIHFHDTKILKVIEDTQTDTFTMEVIYPVDWENNQFEKRRLIFEDAIDYKISEIPFVGSPTILDANIISKDGRRSRIRLETNAGYRELSCVSVQLAK